MNLRLSKDKRKFTADVAKVMGHYDIATPEETLDELINTNKSIELIITIKQSIIF